MNKKAILEVKGVTKKFGGVIALNNVDLICESRSIHAILGENGAGKSTLIKIIGGVIEPDSGSVILGTNEVKFNSPRDAVKNGIVCIFQELSLIPDLSIADNISIMEPPKRGPIIDYNQQYKRAEKLLAHIGCEDINPRELCANLSLSHRQMVEIAKALGYKPKILILDEATSALTGEDSERIFKVLKELRDQGISMLYITHHLREAELLADKFTVLRNGERIETFNKGSKNTDEIISMMIGRSISKAYPPKIKKQEDKSTLPVLEVKNLSWGNVLHNISFRIGKGEIVGIGGLDGQGQRELILCLFGVIRGSSGTIKINGKYARIGCPAEAKNIAGGISMIPEDRTTEGLISQMTVGENITLAFLYRLIKFFMIERKRENNLINQMIKKLEIKAKSINSKASMLSGGNQQKVVIAKWLLSRAKCLLLMDPSRGIDVGTKQELYILLRELSSEGTSILLFSTDHDELVGMCDRVIILYRGQIVKKLEERNITVLNIVKSSLNIQ